MPCYIIHGRSSDTAHESLCVTDQVKKFSYSYAKLFS